MRLKSFLFMLVGVMVMISAACGPHKTDTPEPDLNQNNNSNTNGNANANANANANNNQNANSNQNANGNDSGGAKLPVAAGALVAQVGPGDSSPALAFDGQGRLNLFYQASTQTQGHVFLHTQMSADGTWPKPAAATPEFQYLNSLDVLPDSGGGLCMLWSGSQYDASGNSVYGLFKNCQGADGDWKAGATQLGTTASATTFSLSRAPDGTLGAVYVSGSALFFSAIEGQGGVISGTQVAGGAQQVLQGRLAIDAKGGYHAVWQQSSGGSDFSLQGIDSSDDGKTWSAAKALYTGTANNPSSVSLQLVAGAAGQAHLAWDGAESIWYRRWSAAGGWGEAAKLSGDAKAEGVRLAVTKAGLARAVWSNIRTSNTVALAAQAADGSWGPAQSVTPTRGYEEALAVDAPGTSHIVWRGDDGLRYLAMP